MLCSGIHDNSPHPQRVRAASFQRCEGTLVCRIAKNVCWGEYRWISSVYVSFFMIMEWRVHWTLAFEEQRQGRPTPYLSWEASKRRLRWWMTRGAWLCIAFWLDSEIYYGGFVVYAGSTLCPKTYEEVLVQRQWPHVHIQNSGFVSSQGGAILRSRATVYILFPLVARAIANSVPPLTIGWYGARPWNYDSVAWEVQFVERFSSVCPPQVSWNRKARHWSWTCSTFILFYSIDFAQ